MALGFDSENNLVYLKDPSVVSKGGKQFVRLGSDLQLIVKQYLK